MTTEEILRAKKWSDIRQIFNEELLGKKHKEGYGFTQ